MESEKNDLWFVRHHDDEWFDEITLRVVPRYKTSDLSGDEWRVSWVCQLKRKGVVLAETTWSTRTAALLGLGGFVNEQSCKPMGMTWNETAGAPESAFCHQPGCAERAVSVYRLKKEYCLSGHGTEPSGPPHAVAFCLRHLRRGDCGLEDADANYVVVSGPGPGESMAHPDDESPAQRMDVVVGSVRDLPAAIQKALDEHGGARD